MHFLLAPLNQNKTGRTSKSHSPSTHHGGNKGFGRNYENIHEYDKHLKKFAEYDDSKIVTITDMTKITV